ncbi:hypothetical protein KDA_64720 [Dictyobacter alpinus]|uniref:Uncharacterized protein n=1 Tax=Dictyobacter alpinus TaxID=2014873 RepID=A0A402BHV1_9CHLR|nr:hypothetical protein KDA_64720 [Dictyobacter alpinus]
MTKDNQPTLATNLADFLRIHLEMDVSQSLKHEILAVGLLALKPLPWLIYIPIIGELSSYGAS